MVPTTRRHLLSAAATTLAAGLAGCDGSLDADREDAPDQDRPPNVERDPEHVTLRSGGDDPLFWTVSGATDAEGRERSPPEHARGRELVADPDAAEALGFADVDGAAAARRFVAETDFEEATLYVESRYVEACRELRLCYVTWSRDEVDTQYGGFYRDADASCEEGARDRVVTALRIPDALDPDAVTSHGSGYRSSGCRVPPWERADRTDSTPQEVGPITDADGAGDGGNESDAQ